MQRSTRTIQRAVGSGALVALLILAVPRFVFAQGPDVDSTGERANGTRRLIASTHMPLIEARSFEEAQAKYRQRAQGEAPGAIGTTDIRDGSCGSSWMFISDDGWLSVRFEFGASTSKPVQMVEQEWRWDLYKWEWPFWIKKTDRPGVDHQVTYTWSQVDYKSVGEWGAGDYKGVLGHLRVLHADGSVCYGLQPEDAKSIDEGGQNVEPWIRAAVGIVPTQGFPSPVGPVRVFGEARGLGKSRFVAFGYLGADQGAYPVPIPGRRAVLGLALVAPSSIHTRHVEGWAMWSAAMSGGVDSPLQTVTMGRHESCGLWFILGMFLDDRAAAVHVGLPDGTELRPDVRDRGFLVVSEDEVWSVRVTVLDVEEQQIEEFSFPEFSFPPRQVG